MQWVLHNRLDDPRCRCHCCLLLYVYFASVKYHQGKTVMAISIEHVLDGILGSMFRRSLLLITMIYVHCACKPAANIRTHHSGNGVDALNQPTAVFFFIWLGTFITRRLSTRCICCLAKYTKRQRNVYDHTRTRVPRTNKGYVNSVRRVKD